VLGILWLLGYLHHRPISHNIESLCRKELRLIVEVVKCRRLGQLKPGRQQPVLATLRSADDVESVIKVAKDLRGSDDVTVRNSVYINPDMTKAESLAAYQRRCQRREMATRRATIQTRSAGESVSSTAPVAAEHGTSSAVSQLPVVQRSPAISQHSIPVLNTRYLPSSHSSPVIEYQPSQPSSDTVQNVVAAVSVTVPPPATATSPAAAGTMDPQLDTDITTVITAPTGDGSADVQCSATI